ACTSSRPTPSTRIAARCGACVIATLEITAALLALALVGSCAPALVIPPSTALATIRQPHRKAGQFIFIAVLLHWSKFSYLPGAPRASRMHLCPFRGMKRHPSQSFPPVRRTAGRLRAENTCATADWSPLRSSRWTSARCRLTGAKPPANRLSPEED